MVVALFLGCNNKSGNSVPYETSGSKSISEKSDSEPLTNNVQNTNKEIRYIDIDDTEDVEELKNALHNAYSVIEDLRFKLQSAQNSIDDARLTIGNVQMDIENARLLNERYLIDNAEMDLQDAGLGLDDAEDILNDAELDLDGFYYEY